MPEGTSYEEINGLCNEKGGCGKFKFFLDTTVTDTNLVGCRQQWVGARRTGGARHLGTTLELLARIY